MSGQTSCIASILKHPNIFPSQIIVIKYTVTRPQGRKWQKMVLHTYIYNEKSIGWCLTEKPVHDFNVVNNVVVSFTSSPKT